MPESTPALDWLLQEQREADIDGRPYECCYCPFASQTFEQKADTNWADPGEGGYQCALLDLPNVWGESPKCAPADWRAKARSELEAIRASPR